MVGSKSTTGSLLLLHQSSITDTPLQWHFLSSCNNVTLEIRTPWLFLKPSLIQNIFPPRLLFCFIVWGAFIKDRELFASESLFHKLLNFFRPFPRNLMGLCSALKLPASPAATVSRLLKVSGASAPSPPRALHIRMPRYMECILYIRMEWNRECKMKNWELLQPKKVFSDQDFYWDQILGRS